MMKNYTCESTKDEIITAILEEFENINKDYVKSLRDNDKSQDRNLGRYIAMIDLLTKVKIYPIEN